MKRMMLFVLLVSLLASTVSLKVNAEEPEMLTDVLKNTNQEEINPMLDEERFDRTMEDISLDGDAFLLSYMTCLGAWGETDWNTVLTKAKNEEHKYLIVLREQTFKLRAYANESKFGVGRMFEKTPTYVQDILNGECQQAFLGQNVQITNVICFNFRREDDELTIVYETDKGVFVRYYENNWAEAVEFTWEDYIQKAMAYWEYISSYEYNYSPEGDPLAGANVSFLEWHQNSSQYTKKSVSQQQGRTVVCIVVVGVAAIATTVGIVLYSRRKKR